MKEYIMEQKKVDDKNYMYEQRQELIRCKDCRRVSIFGICTNERTFGRVICNNPDWFCADGEAKKND